MRFAEGREGVAEFEESLFRGALQLLGQSEEIGNTDALDHSNIDLASEHLCAFVFEQLLELVHEDDEVEGIESSLHQIVGFVAGEVVAGLEYAEGRLGVGFRLGATGILFP